LILANFLLDGDTISANAATATGGGPGRASGGADGGGAHLTPDTPGPSVIINTTVTDNTATSPSASTPVLSGVVGGGGIAMINGGGGLALASDTIGSNAVVAGTFSLTLGGNLYMDNLAAPMSLDDTIISGGVAQASAVANCSISASTVDGGHNLESTTPSQCHLGAGSGDLIGVDPLLGGLQVNGEGTPTRALLAGSPAIGAGGVCVDPSRAGDPPLAIDERGLPRPNPCDIGAFQHQPLALTVTPAISGQALVGARLACSDGTWSGEAPIGFTLAWTRGGAVIPGATGAAYAPRPADAGHSLACRVTAKNAYASVSASSATKAVPVPKLSKVSQSHTRWRGGSNRAKVAKRRKAPVGTTFKFTLNESATISLTFRSHGPGVKGHTVSFKSVKAGAHRLRFAGRLKGSKRLAPGNYKVSIVAGDGATHSVTKTEKFTIVS
jgi:hypothetical protein